MTLLINLEAWFRRLLNAIGGFIPLLAVRILLAWEFWEAGVEKFNGANWFSAIQANFPFPFSIIDVQISWFMATWFELLGSVAILVGLGTRYMSISLCILTVVAAIAVHIPVEGWSSWSDMLAGYAISNKGFGNYKLPLMYLVLFLPLIFLGPGKLSIDHLIYSYRRNGRGD
ncbi:MAG: DoxX family protein [Pseudomonadales bacterium]|nr:DoxX family protein [Pseudomonadales bacterium]